MFYIFTFHSFRYYTNWQNRCVSYLFSRDFSLVSYQQMLLKILTNLGRIRYLNHPVFQDGCKCAQRRIQDDPKSWRVKKRKSTLHGKSIPSTFPLPMTPGYASSWRAVRSAKTSPYAASPIAFSILLQGNMKQHMLTHKIRDMPQHMFENKTPSLSGDDSTPLPPSLPPTTPQNLTANSEADVLSPQQQPHPPPPIHPQPPQMQQQSQMKSEQESQPIKREPTETELPLPKRPPSKYHICPLITCIFTSVYVLFKV